MVKRVDLRCCQGQWTGGSGGRANRARSWLASKWSVEVLRGLASAHCCPGSLEAAPHADFLLGIGVPRAQDQGPSGHTRLREQPSPGPVTRAKIGAPNLK